MKFEIVIDRRALSDIQDNLNFYENKVFGLGAKFEAELEIHFNHLSKSPHFQIRYENIRCLPLKKFPFMIHFSIDESKKIVFVHAVLHTSRNPKIWDKK